MGMKKKADETAQIRITVKARRLLERYRLTRKPVASATAAATYLIETHPEITDKDKRGGPA
jgi:hypothetical protein